MGIAEHIFTKPSKTVLPIYRMEDTFKVKATAKNLQQKKKRKITK